MRLLWLIYTATYCLPLFANGSAHDACLSGDFAKCNEEAYEQYNLGQKKEAIFLSQKACKGGNQVGCASFAYYRYQEEENNPVEAAKLYLVACEHRIGKACLNVAYLEQDAQNTEGALAHFKLSCVLDENHGCQSAGYILREGANKAEAAKYFRLGCQQGLKSSCVEADVLENKPGAVERQRKFYREGCDAKEGYCCGQLGWIEQKSGNLTVAKDLFKKSCDYGFQFGCNASSTLEFKAKMTETPQVVRIETLENGLDILLLPNNNMDVSFLEVNIYAGTNAEMTRPNQLAHVTEHTVFRDDLLGDQTYLDMLIREGGKSNAITSDERTTFYSTLPYTKTKWMIETFSQILHPRKFSMTQVDKAKREVNIELTGTKKMIVAFGQNPFMDQINEEFGLPSQNRPFYKNSLSTAAIGRDDVQGFYEKYYHPKNMSVILIGKFNPDEALAWLRAGFGGFSSVGKKKRTEPVPHPKLSPLLISSEAGLNGARITIGTKFWNVDNADEQLIKAYFKHLSLRLMNELRSRDASTYTVSDSGVLDTRKFGYWYITLDTPAKLFEKNLKYVQKKIANETRNKKLSSETIKDMKTVFQNYQESGGSSVESLKQLAYELLNSKTTFNTIELPHAVVNRMTDDEIRQRLSKIFARNREFRILAAPPLLSGFGAPIVIIVSIVAAFYLSRRLFGGKLPIKNMQYSQKSIYGYTGFFLVSATIIFALILVSSILSAVFHLYPDSLDKTYFLKNYISSAVNIIGEFVAVSFVLSRLPTGIWIDQHSIIIQASRFSSWTYPVNQIASVETMSLWGALRRNKFKGFYSYFGFSKRGVLITTHKGQSFFMGFEDRDAIVTEIRKRIAPTMNPVVAPDFRQPFPIAG